MSKKPLRRGITLVALILIFALPVFAYGASPDDAVEATTTMDQYGSSRWRYKDAHDSVEKFEGGYDIGGGPSGWGSCLACHDPGFDFTHQGPHGGYDTGTNKCKVCHAVHRANGAYYLLRSDSQDDACAYCHLNGGMFSRIIVYDLNPNGIYTNNGHTIGASSVIPDSSVKQWLEEIELVTFDGDGNVVTATAYVRRYYERRNKMFRFSRHHGQSAVSNDTSGRSAYGRVGPLALRCMNCHQPHNATDLIWKPLSHPPTSSTPGTRLEAGYRLLRASPSGSIQGSKIIYDDGTTSYTADQAMIERVGFLPAGQEPTPTFSGVPKANVIRVPEDATIGPSNTGYPYTIWTRWPETSFSRYQGALYRDPAVVNQDTLSVWCADCHNLNIGYPDEVPAEFGLEVHGGRTHPVPFVGAENGPGQCYSCHRNDMPLNSFEMDEYGLTYPTNVRGKYLYNPAANECESCHFGTATYYNLQTLADENVDQRFPWAWIYIDYRYDWPHSGGQGNESYPSYIKLLGPWTAEATEGGYAFTMTTITVDNLDAVCKRCHPGIGVNH